MRYLTSNGVIALAIILAACNPTLTIQSTGSPAPSLPDTTECIVLGWTDTTRPSITPIAHFIYTERYAGAWDEPLVLANLKAMALKKGANLLRITKVQYPGQRTRGAVAVDIYNVPDPRIYEKQIIWSPYRRLTVADFKGAPPLTADSVQGSGSDCELYFPILYYGKIIESGYVAQARFHCRSSWINRKATDPDALLLHEQGSFDLCELYCRQLEFFVQHTTFSHANYRRLILGFYAQIYNAWQATRACYEAETDHGLDPVQQAKWTRDIGAGSPFTVSPDIPSDAQQDSMTKALTPPPDSALVYIIRPNNYNTVFWRRIGLNPFYFIVPYFLFINPDLFRVYDGAANSYWIRKRNYIYRIYSPGTRNLSPERFADSSFKGHTSLSLYLAPGKVYYVEMKLIEHRFMQFDVPVLKLLSEKEGSTILKQSTLFNDYQGLPLPVPQDILQ